MVVHFCIEIKSTIALVLKTNYVHVNKNRVISNQEIFM